MTQEKQRAGLPDGLLENLRAGTLHERTPKIAAALSALVGDHGFLLCVLPQDGGEALVLGNRSVAAGVDMLEQALAAAREYVEEDGDDPVPVH